MSRKDDIIDEIKTRLGNISVANGYLSDVAEVAEDIKAPEELRSFPVLFVIDGPERKTDADVDELDATLTVIVTGFVEATEGKEQLRRNLQIDVEKALTNTNGVPDHFLGGQLHITNVKPSEIKTDKGGYPGPYAMFDYDFEIKYFQPYGTP